jgi:hypothetical protein
MGTKVEAAQVRRRRCWPGNAGGGRRRRQTAPARHRMSSGGAARRRTTPPDVGAASQAAQWRVACDKEAARRQTTVFNLLFARVRGKDRKEVASSVKPIIFGSPSINIRNLVVLVGRRK